MCCAVKPAPKVRILPPPPMKKEKQYWLLKTEAEEFSIDDLKKRKTEPWTGVRNFQARNNLKAMKKGDLSFIYHTGSEKAVVGIGKVLREYFPDPTTKEPGWVAVDIGFIKKFATTIPLVQIKNDPNLKNMVLAKAPRLSVQPVSEKQFTYIEKLAKA